MFPLSFLLQSVILTATVSAYVGFRQGTAQRMEDLDIRRQEVESWEGAAQQKRMQDAKLKLKAFERKNK